MIRSKGQPVRSPSSTDFYKPRRILAGRLKLGDDLLPEITSLCRKNNISTGYLSIIGAVRNARLGYYNQAKRSYTGCVKFRRKLEIASCAGNISLKDGEIFVHLHIVLAGLDGKAFGGHLMPGTEVFAAEYFIMELAGKKLHRVKDPSTGLPLWSLK